VADRRVGGETELFDRRVEGPLLISPPQCPGLPLATVSASRTRPRLCDGVHPLPV
jgi:hypothetical protein